MQSGRHRSLPATIGHREESAMSDTQGQDPIATELGGDLFPNGIDAETGRPLPGLDGERAGKQIVKKTRSDNLADQEISAGVEKFGLAQDAVQSYGTTVGIDAEDLAQTGWGVVLPADVDPGPLKEALKPLLAKRQMEAGRFYVEFDGPRGVRAGESALDWLARQPSEGKGPGLHVVDPENGVPFYLLLVASPEQIPTQFQYMLDMFWAVGRLHFDTVDEYARYAASVVAYETAAKPPPRYKQLTVFATEHPSDAATRMFTQAVAKPFASGANGQGPVAQGLNYAVDDILGGAATKACFTEVLRGTRPKGSPALLFSGTHGMAFRAEDPRLPTCQGALVCQDWEAGSIRESDWFSAVDVPADACLHGMIHFLFACYGGGWEKFDTFRDGPGGTARQIAPSPGVARLPQAMLAHPKGGALAVLAHVDRAWSFSFRTVNNVTQNAALREVVRCLLLGLRVGNATDRFNMQWAALAAPLSDALRDAQPAPSPAISRQIARLWIARDDARNYAILGDPAVRLRVDCLRPGT